MLSLEIKENLNCKIGLLKIGSRHESVERIMIRLPGYLMDFCEFRNFCTKVISPLTVKNRVSVCKPGIDDGC